MHSGSLHHVYNDEHKQINWIKKTFKLKTKPPASSILLHTFHNLSPPERRMVLKHPFKTQMKKRQEWLFLKLITKGFDDDD